MNIIKPDYYDKFECIGAPCPDSCCVKWEIDIDEDSAKYYKSVQGQFGDRLRKTLKVVENENRFPLVQGRCPFLNKGNLCDIYINIGKDKLCKTCTQFPRFYQEYGLTREIGVELACPVAADLIVLNKEKFHTEIELTDEGIKDYNDIDPQKYFELKKERERIIDFAENREIPLKERLLSFLENEENSKVRSSKEEYKDFCKSLEVMDSAWIEILDTVGKKPTDIQLEQVFVYYVYRYFLSSVFDGLTREKIKLAMFAVIVISQIGINKAYKFAKEIEHGDGNIDSLMKSFQSDERFSEWNFRKIIMTL